MKLEEVAPSIILDFNERNEGKGINQHSGKRFFDIYVDRVSIGT